LVLQSAGYHVLTARNGREGVTLMSRQRVNAIVLDYSTGEMEGESIAAALKRCDPDVPILLLSSYMYLPDSVLHNVDACIAIADGPAAMLESLRGLLNQKHMSQGAA
jgi:DNA-binding response OmpR family regulator